MKAKDVCDSRSHSLASFRAVKLAH